MSGRDTIETTKTAAAATVVRYRDRYERSALAASAMSSSKRAIDQHRLIAPPLEAGPVHVVFQSFVIRCCLQGVRGLQGDSSQTTPKFIRGNGGHQVKGVEAQA